jgi:rubrerythrin
MTKTTKTSKSSGTEKHAEEVALYAQLREKVGQGLGRMRDTITGEAVAETVDKAATELREAGQHSRETVTKLAETLKKDLASTHEAMRPRLEEFKADAGKATEVLRDRGGAFWHEAVKEGGHLAGLTRDKGGAAVVQVAHAVAQWTDRMGDKLDKALVYHTGELTHGGEYRCESCGATVQVPNPGHLPACEKCGDAEYRRA